MKSAIQILLILIMISSLGAGYAAPNGSDNGSSGGTSGNGNDTDVVISYPMDPSLLFSYSLTVNAPETAQVNDTVQIIVTATNTGLVDWCPIGLNMPLPPDTQFVSFVVPDRNLQNYNPSTGIWDVYRMRHIERGQQKTAILTVKILDSAAGKKLPVVASFNHLVLEGYGVDVTDQTFSRSASIYVKPLGGGPGTGGNTDGNDPGNNSGNNPNQDDNGNGPDPVIVPGSDPLNRNILQNLASSSDNSLSKSLQSGGAGGGNENPKAYEIDQVPPISKDDLPSYLIAVLLIIGMIVAGYYYGMKKED